MNDDERYMPFVSLRALKASRKDLIAGTIQCLKDIADKDPKSCHKNADDILCALLVKLGFEAVVDEYNKLQPKWYA